MITAIVLAAGASRRFGSQKLLAPLHGKPIVRWAVENVLAARLDEVMVVVGREGSVENPQGTPVFAWKGETLEE